MLVCKQFSNYHASPGHSSTFTASSLSSTLLFSWSTTGTTPRCTKCLFVKTPLERVLTHYRLHGAISVTRHTKQPLHGEKKDALERCHAGRRDVVANLTHGRQTWMVLHPTIVAEAPLAPLGPPKRISRANFTNKTNEKLPWLSN